MAGFGIGAVARASRLVCTATLLFLFFLPLHVHFSLSPQLASPCSCVQGARTQFIAAEGASVVALALQFGVLLEPQLCEWSSATSLCQYVRGPPLPLAV